MRRRRCCSSRPTSPPRSIARTARRHRLPSEASRRYERGVDPALAAAAAEVAVRHARRARRCQRRAGHRRRHPRAGRRAATSRSASPSGWRAGRTPPRSSAAGSRTSAAPSPAAPTCSRSRRRPGGPTSPARPSSSRRSCGSRATTRSRSCCPQRPRVAASRPSSACAARASRALAAAGLVEVVLPPFVSDEVLEVLGARHDLAAAAPTRCRPRSRCCARRCCPACSRRSPQREPRPGRRGGVRDRPRLPRRGRLRAGARRRRTADARAAGRARRRRCPTSRATSAWRSPGAPASWDAAVSAVVEVARALGLRLELRAAAHGPFHPGRTAELLLDGRRVGLAGELHPRVVAALGLPARTCAAEANLDVLVAAAAARGPLPAPRISHFPPASVDVALVVADEVPAADVERALRDGAGELLEGCGCSTSSAARRSARASARWRTPCACARPTAPSPTSRCSAPATPRSPRPGAASARSCAACSPADLPSGEHARRPAARSAEGRSASEWPCSAVYGRAHGAAGGGGGCERVRGR